MKKKISISGTDESALEIAELLADYLSAQRIESEIVDADGDINLNLTGNTESEAYSLDIAEDQINIQSDGAAGLFYGVQSLIQIISNNKESLPQLAIQDEPRFGYRGMHLDVGRHMFPVEFVKRAQKIAKSLK